MRRFRSFAFLGLLVAGWLAACGSEPERAKVATAFEVRVPVGENVEAQELELLLRVLTVRLAGFQPEVVGFRANDARDGVVLELVDEPTAEQARALELRVQSTGAFAMWPVVDPGSTEPDAADQRDTMLEWRAAHSSGTAAEFNATPPELGGPVPTYRWLPYRSSPERWVCCDVRGQSARETRVTEADLAPDRIVPHFDTTGHPCLVVEPRSDRVQHVLAFTSAFVGQQVAVVIGDESVLTAPHLHSPLGGSFSLEGRLSEVDRDALLVVLRSGAIHGRLPFRPELVRVAPAAK